MASKKRRKLVAPGKEFEKEIRPHGAEGVILLRDTGGKVFVIPLGVVEAHRRADLERHGQVMEMLDGLKGRTPGLTHALKIDTIQIMDGGP